MKLIKQIVAVMLIAVSATSCIDNKDVLFNDTLVEIDAAAFNARTSGYPFPLLARVPLEPGRGVYNTANSYGGIDPALTRTYADTIRMRVNLVGRQQSTAQTFDMSVNTQFTTAVEGVHFALIDRQVTIPANSNFGFCRWVVRNPGPTNALPVSVVFQLRSNNSIKVNENYQYIGWSISQ